MKRSLFTLIWLSFTLGGCVEPTNEASPIDYRQPQSSVTGGALIDAMPSDPSGLIYMVAGESAAAVVTSHLFNTLLTYNQQLDLKGELAQSWSISNDQKTITFQLKPNLKWADGKPLTSDDVLFTWQLVTDEKTRSPYASDFLLVKKVATPDAQTFTVTYEQPYAPALDSWSGLQILPKHLLEGEDIHTTHFAQQPIGSHYYQLASWQHGEHIKLSRNPNAVLGQAKIDQLITRIIPDNSAQFLELMADNIDSMSLDPIKYSRIIPNRPALKKNVNLYKELGNGYTYLGFNLKRAPFDDIRVRQAINYAIDKQEIIDGALLGLGISIASPYKPGTRWSNPTLKPYPYDPKKAKQLLQVAGFTEHDSDGYLLKNGKRFSFEIITNAGNKQREKTFVLIQHQLKKVGIHVTFRALEWASLLNQYIHTGDFEAVIMGWGLGLDPDQFSIWHSSQQAQGQFNFIGYENKAVDALLSAGRSELDPNKRQQIYHQFAEKLLADSPIVYLSSGYGLSAIHKRVQGILAPVPPAGVTYDAHEWYIPIQYRRNQINAK